MPAIEAGLPLEVGVIRTLARGSKYMSLFVYIGRDGPQGLELRKTVREHHIATLEALDEQGRIRFAGPIRDDAGSPCGSVVIFEAQDMEAARAVVDSDPYVREGVFERVDLHESMAVFPRK